MAREVERDNGTVIVTLYRKYDSLGTSSHPRIPNFVLTPEETADVIAYILSLRDRPSYLPVSRERSADRLRANWLVTAPGCRAIGGGV